MKKNTFESFYIAAFVVSSNIIETENINFCDGVLASQKKKYVNYA